MPQPLLFLGVDAVLRPFELDEPPPGFVPLGMYPDEEIVLINPQHGIWIDELADHYEVVWVSAWNDDAKALFAPLLDIDPRAMLSVPEQADAEMKAKAGVIAAFARGRAACWIDDEHGVAGRTWAHERAEPTLLLTVDPKVGLAAEQVNEALGWALRVGSVTSTVGV